MKKQSLEGMLGDQQKENKERRKAAERGARDGGNTGDAMADIMVTESRGYWIAKKTKELQKKAKEEEQTLSERDAQAQAVRAYEEHSKLRDPKKEFGSLAE